MIFYHPNSVLTSPAFLIFQEATGCENLSQPTNSSVVGRVLNLGLKFPFDLFLLRSHTDLKTPNYTLNSIAAL